jgi:hypothetical protein
LPILPPEALSSLGLPADAIFTSPFAVEEFLLLDEASCTEKLKKFILNIWTIDIDKKFLTENKAVFLAAIKFPAMKLDYLDILDIFMASFVSCSNIECFTETFSKEEITSILSSVRQRLIDTENETKISVDLFIHDFSENMMFTSIDSIKFFDEMNFFDMEAFKSNGNVSTDLIEEADKYFDIKNGFAVDG